MKLNLRQIEIFRAVMTTGSISGASQLLFVSQPAVSRLLSHTEQRVGFALFERIKGRLYATPEAKRLIHEVDLVYQGVQRVNELAADLAKNRTGILNIVSSQSVGQTLIPKALALFQAQHTDVKLTFQCLGFSYLKERLLSHRADLGIIISPMEHPSLEVTPLCRNRLVCILPDNHELTHRATLTLADLRPYPLISYERDTPLSVIVTEMYQAAGDPLDPAIEVGSPQNAVALVHMGAGVALVDEFSARSWSVSSPLVVRQVDNAPLLNVNLVHMRFEPLSQLTQAFIAQLKQLVKQQSTAAQ
jgi:DNA-binding transcriptional LysR family regulator